MSETNDQMAARLERFLINRPGDANDVALRAGAQALRSAPQWSPIETAPKDGAPFLAASEFLGQPCVVRIYWDRGKWEGDYGNQTFDAWMPLPPAPSQET